MEADGHHKTIEAHLAQARQALAVEQFAEAAVALSLAFFEAAKLPVEERFSASQRIASLAEEVERAYRLYLERKRRLMEEADRRAQMEREKRRAAEEIQMRQKQMQKTEPEKPETKIEKKIENLDVRARVASSTDGVTLLSVTSAKLGSKEDAKKVAEALKNKPVLQVDTPALHPAQPRNLKLQLGGHRQRMAARIEHQPRKPKINIGSIS